MTKKPRSGWTLRRLARELGCSYATIRRWVSQAMESGELPACRTPGGHRRVPAELAERMVRGEWGQDPGGCSGD